jgi:hypothetical protein
MSGLGFGIQCSLSRNKSRVDTSGLRLRQGGPGFWVEAWAPTWLGEDGSARRCGVQGLGCRVQDLKLRVYKGRDLIRLEGLV